jgi:hypothetical protein
MDADADERDDRRVATDTRTMVWLTRALLLGAIGCTILAIVGGLRRDPVLATVPTLLQSATVLLLTTIVLMLDGMRSDWRSGGR